MSIWFLIYDIIFLLGLISYLPICFWRKKINFSAIWEKLGFISACSGKESVWIQVVSVGEVNLVEGLISTLKDMFNYSIVISTTTLTGYRLAKKRYSSKAEVIFFPFDLSLVLERAIKAIKPKIFIAVETEIWPNLYCRLKRKNIPIIIINGRISHKAFKRYRVIRPILRRILNQCDYIGVQNQFYKEKFLFLGAKEEKIIVSGNMKFESISSDVPDLLEIKGRYLSLMKKEGSLLVIAASTHFPEEEIVLDIYKDLKEELKKDISLLIAPRHIERISGIEKMVASRGFDPVRISRIEECFPKNAVYPIRDNSSKTTDDYRRQPISNRVYLLDTIGKLLYFYDIADLCFVGGSLARCGGQNILEPIYFLKPTVFGPYMDNFGDIQEAVLTAGAGIQVENTQELKEIIARLINDRALRDNLRDKCRKVFEEERASYEKNIQIILRCLG
ncbi:MAG: glycosyltransferase N-terminal domain-containing protein [Candidatus Omnitrophota bacterium]